MKRASFKPMNETQAVKALLAQYPLDQEARQRAKDRARKWAQHNAHRKTDVTTSLLQGFDLGSAEGRALMELAEAYLRIPDSHTRDQLLRDKIEAAGWDKDSANATSKLAQYALRLGKGVLGTPLAMLAGPIMGTATKQGMTMLAQHFVMGESIDRAIANARKDGRPHEWFSFDVLGEGARTYEDAQRYFESYLDAIERVGKSQAGGISVKLSALHPKFEETHRKICFTPLCDMLFVLAQKAAAHNIPLMVDAEEERRCDLTLSIFENVRSRPELKAWSRMGLAVQAYLKRAPLVIDFVQDLGQRLDVIINIRLVKGAYWDSEIKYAQIMGHDDFPVFTQKTHTDLSYIVCGNKLLQGSHIRAAFGSHNALSLACLAELAGHDVSAFETQRLHGMGDHIHEAMREEGYSVGVYAPVGPHRDLLPYLVRRLLENGANTSFLKSAAQGDLEKTLTDPATKLEGKNIRPHPAIRHPHDLYPDRKNSHGIDLGSQAIVQQTLAQIPPAINVQNAEAMSAQTAQKAVETACAAFRDWASTPVEERAQKLERLADLFEERKYDLYSLLQEEARKTLPDAISEVREAADFCRYYAQQARVLFAPQFLPGPDGEKNMFTRHGRGVFVCIAPWNFPLAIFIGQAVSALAAGNCAIAKPAEQTPRIGQFAVDLAHEAGIPKDILICTQGDGTIGAALTSHPKIGGVAFTGSYEVGKIIQRTLAAKDEAIVPFIAETAGLNAMAVDSSALPEQVVDDVLLSAFGSAGQRCSALRILLIEEHAAKRVLPLLQGAMRTLRVGDPRDTATDVGPVIDNEAVQNLHKSIADLKTRGKILHECAHTETDSAFVAPIAVDMTGQPLPDKEIFGPVLQIYRVTDLVEAVRSVNAKQFALTFGLHTRLPSREKEFAQLAEAGNIYINRSMIGAVVGVQPFGGHNRSGTGPKAGGPQTLLAYSLEKHVSVNSAAAGGNASLVALEDDL